MSVPDLKSAFGNNQASSNRQGVAEKLTKAVHVVVEKAEAHLTDAGRALREAQAAAGSRQKIGERAIC